VRQISLKALKVNFLREWLDFQILSMGNWRIRGFREGFFSSGDPKNNDGVFPLLPTSIIVGTEVSVEGEWSAADRTVVDSHLKQAEPLSLGPFPLVCAGSDASEIDSTGAIRSRVAHIVGYISNLVPFAPQSTDLIRGSVLVNNNGAFVARFSVQYQQGGRTTASESGNFPVLSGKHIDIPSAATNIALKIEIMTCPPPFETWKTVATYQFDKPATKCYELSGTTGWPTIAEIDCPG